MATATAELANTAIGIATALSGLILVFLGGIASSYSSIPPEYRNDVVTRQFRRRAWPPFIGFLASVFALISGSIFLLGMPCDGLVWAAFTSLGLTTVTIVWSAIRELAGIS